MMAPIHDRMPVVLAPQHWEQWLDPSYDDVERLQTLLSPAPNELLNAYPVSTEVNNVRNNHSDLLVSQR